MDLQIARAIRKKTQWEVSRLTGINQSKISLIENKYIFPNEAEKNKIAKALDLKVEDIEWFEDEK